MSDQAHFVSFGCWKRHGVRSPFFARKNILFSVGFLADSTNCIWRELEKAALSWRMPGSGRCFLWRCLDCADGVAAVFFLDHRMVPGDGGNLLFYRLVWRDVRRQKDFLYQVEFSWAGKTIHVCGFADTGNFLYEPMGRMPVSVMDKSVLQKYYKGSFKDLIEKHDENGIRMIPYHSVEESEAL